MSALEEYDWSISSFFRHFIALMILPMILILWPLMWFRYTFELSTLFKMSRNVEDRLAGEE
tara:strand:+ start:1277 stop:1459 length:183 start_codon:yes stop_codon:yes gene_type:complete